MLPNQSRNLHLDGLRGLAILAVMLYHLGLNYSAFSKPEYVFQTFMHMGWAGVDLFFVLSGFLITGILLETRKQPGYFKNFYARRFLRIFPLYYLVLTIFLLVIPNIPYILHATDFWLPNADRSQAWYWLYLSNIHFALTGQFQHATLGVTWSLAVEEHFYLIWPLVVLLVSRANLVLVCAAIVLFSPAVRALMLSSDMSTLAVFLMTYARLDGLAAGALIACLAREDRGVEGLRGIGYGLLIGCGLALAGLIVAIRMDTGIAIEGIHETLFGHPWMQMGGYSLVTGFCAGLVILMIQAHPPRILGALFRNGFLRLCGKYSYAMYLLHSFVLIMIGTHWFDFREYPEWGIGAFALFCLATLACSLALGWLTWTLLENPCLKLKRHFTYSVDSPKNQ